MRFQNPQGKEEMGKQRAALAADYRIMDVVSKRLWQVGEGEKVKAGIIREPEAEQN
jgi:hypothetical protein